MNNGIQTIVPKTSYLTYADYWLQSCFGTYLPLNSHLSIIWRCFPAFIFVMIGVLVIFCAFHNSEREDVCDNFQIQQRTFLSQVISWADFLNRRSREVMPFLFAIFLLFFFLIATDVINVE